MATTISTTAAVSTGPILDGSEMVGLRVTG
jgi:hypothetical protein